MPEVTDLRPGDPEEIAGYRVVGRLGAGGQGVVYLATGPSGERVAIKQLRFGPQDERARQQFAKEVAAARLVAPFCTAQVLDADLDGPAPYVVSEYIDGLSLQQRVERRGPMSGATLHRLAIGTATALAAIHQVGVVHRDFKPANVMLAHDGPRVIDFGIARDLSTDTTVTSRVFGTPAYMAPEQLRAERVGPATDLFAWASVIAFAATGRPPFEAPHMVAVMHRISTGEPDLTGVPADLIPVLRRCLDKDPAARPTAQQTLALLLGRPAPARDVADATSVLAEATGIVHAAAVSATTQDPPVAWPAPTLQYPRAGTTAQYPAAHPTAQNAVPVAAARADRAPDPVRPWGEGNLGSHPPGSPGRGRRRSTGLVVIALVAVLIGGAFAVRALDRASRLTDRRNAANPGVTSFPSAGAGPVRTQPAAVPSTTEEPVTPWTSAPEQTSDNSESDGNEDATVPETFDGTWKGVGLQPRGRVTSWPVRVELDEGESTGELKLKSLHCSGELTVVTATDDLLELFAVMDDNPDGACAPSATVQLTRLGPRRLSFRWQDTSASQNQATGLLQRQ
jgi:hypothetical protein